MKLGMVRTVAYACQPAMVGEGAPRMGLGIGVADVADDGVDARLSTDEEELVKEVFLDILT